jgi:ribose transport system permease protein
MLRRFSDYFILVTVLAALVLLFGLMRDSFFTTSTLGSVTNRIPALALVATGMTLVMITGGIDLSVGSLLGFCGAAVGVMMTDWQWGLALALVFSVIIGSAVGGTTGALSVKLSLPSFIVSLGMMEMARGLAFLTTNSQTKYIGTNVESLGAPFGGLVISPAFLISVVFVILGQITLSHTVLGRHWIAIGANRDAAFISGVPVDRPRIIAHALLGALTGLAAVFNCSKLGSADPNAGVGFELEALLRLVVHFHQAVGTLLLRLALPTGTIVLRIR